MVKINKALITSFLALISSVALAQEPVEMADKFRADGKIYVVVAIIAVVLVGLFIYLFRLDRKLTKLEKQIGNKL